MSCLQCFPDELLRIFKLCKQAVKLPYKHRTSLRAFILQVKGKNKKRGNICINATLRRICVTIVAVEK